MDVDGGMDSGDSRVGVFDSAVDSDFGDIVCSDQLFV